MNIMKPSAALKYLFTLYNAGWTCAIPFLKRNPRISDGFDQRALSGCPLPSADIWIQSASAGEAYLSLEILKHLETPKRTSVLLTANTRQGLDILEKEAEKINENDGNLLVYARFSPFDKPTLMEKAVSQVNPKLMVLVELEIWPGLLKALKNKGIPVLIVNGRLTERSLRRYRLYPGLWTYLAPSLVLAMADEDAGRFRVLFPESRVETLPNIKFDRVLPVSEEEEDNARNPLSSLVDAGSPVIVLGSVREEEEQAVSSIIQSVTSTLPQARIFLFPRHMHRLTAWKSRLLMMNADFALRSSITTRRPRVVLWDVFGELTHAYKLAQAAFVGGSLAPLGGQNVLEPLACGVIPVIGPSWENFAWVGEGIVESGLLEVCDDAAKVSNKLIERAKNPENRLAVKIRTETYLKSRRGGTARVCREIERLYLNETRNLFD